MCCPIGRKFRHLSPCANTVLGIAVGENLLETLALNLVPDKENPTATWTQARASQADFVNNSRTTARSIAETYTWLGQAVRLNDSTVMTARGFKLDSGADPMKAISLDKKGKASGITLQPRNLEPWLLGCMLAGFQAIPSASLVHAESTGCPFKVRMLAQVSDEKRKVKILETFDETFPRTVLNAELAQKVLGIRRLLVFYKGEFIARTFVSTVQDRIRIGQPVHLEEVINEVPTDLTRFQKQAIVKIAHTGGHDEK
jgi:CRISPR-associated protein Cse1 (CRISPR_cse1)